MDRYVDYHCIDPLLNDEQKSMIVTVQLARRYLRIHAKSNRVIFKLGLLADETIYGFLRPLALEVMKKNALREVEKDVNKKDVAPQELADLAKKFDEIYLSKLNEKIKQWYQATKTYEDGNDDVKQELENKYPNSFYRSYFETKEFTNQMQIRLAASKGVYKKVLAKIDEEHKNKPLPPALGYRGSVSSPKGKYIQKVCLFDYFISIFV